MFEIENVKHIISQFSGKLHNSLIEMKIPCTTLRLS